MLTRHSLVFGDAFFGYILVSTTDSDTFFLYRGYWEKREYPHRNQVFSRVGSMQLLKPETPPLISTYPLDHK